jgi:hypothetical protein
MSLALNASATSHFLRSAVLLYFRFPGYQNLSQQLPA